MKRNKWLMIGLVVLSIDCAFPRGVDYEFNKVDIRMDVGLRVRDARSDLVSITLKELELVPDHFQSAGLHYGEVVLVDQEITLYPEMAHKRGQFHDTAGLWDLVPGAYDPQTRTAFIRVDKRGGSANTPLHEFGHLVDDALGSPSGERSFVTVWNYCKQNGDMRRHAERSSDEFFADCFAAYLFATETRSDLQIDHSSAYNYMRRLDIEVLRNYERANDGVLRLR